MARRKRETPVQQARRELISELLSEANLQNMDDIQNLFKETIAEFMEGSLESELDDELGYEPYLFISSCQGTQIALLRVSRFKVFYHKFSQVSSTFTPISETDIICPQTDKISQSC